MTKSLVALTLFFLLMVGLRGVWATGVPVSVAPSQWASFGSFSGTLKPGGTANYTLSLDENFDNLLLYAKGGGPSAEDSFTVSLTESGQSWPGLQGELWFVFGPMQLGQYTVVIEAASDASAPVPYEVKFYPVPTVPAAFAGSTPLNASNTASVVQFQVPSDGFYDIDMAAVKGDFGAILDGNNLGVVVANNSTTLQLTQGSHQLEIDADPLQEGTSPTQWSINIAATLNPPTLTLQILPSCKSTVNETTCTFIAQTNATNGPELTPSFDWSSDGGDFNSTDTQAVSWTAQAINETMVYYVNCTVTAQGYLATTASVPVTVTPVPEFGEASVQLLIAALGVGALLVAQRSRKTRVRISERS